MSWLQKRPQTSNPKSFYTIGLNKTILIVGLGNPEAKYDLTRHNIGFFCLDEFVDKVDEMSDWVQKKDFATIVSQGNLGDKRIIAIKPTTYMNLSGEAVKKIIEFYKISPDNVVVVHDDLDIGFGQIRTRVGGSSAGHNGIKSISNTVGENYGRIRVGIGPKHPDKIATENYVLQKFDKAEQSQLTNLSREVISVLQEYIYGDALPSDTRTFIV